MLDASGSLAWLNSNDCGTPGLTLDLSFWPQVHLQTQQEVKRRMVGMAIHVVKSDGVLALYNGLSASLCRQVRSLKALTFSSKGRCQCRLVN